MDDERPAKFEAAYNRAYGQITAYVARRCDSPQDAADVVAETFTVAWRRVDELPDDTEATLWLYGVARKVLANHFRAPTAAGRVRPSSTPSWPICTGTPPTPRSSWTRSAGRSGACPTTTGSCCP